MINIPTADVHNEIWSRLETVEDLKVAVKHCPKCRYPIEKKVGCNHVICSRCAQAFCYHCEGEWADHGDHYDCNASASTFDVRSFARFGPFSRGLSEPEFRLFDTVVRQTG